MAPLLILSLLLPLGAQQLAVEPLQGCDPDAMQAELDRLRAEATEDFLANREAMQAPGEGGREAARAFVERWAERRAGIDCEVGRWTLPVDAMELGMAEAWAVASPSTLLAGIGGLYGDGVQIGAGGLGSRGSGLGTQAETPFPPGTGSGASFGPPPDRRHRDPVPESALAVGQPVVLGAMSREDAEDALERWDAQLRYCWAKHGPDDPDASMELELGVTIAADGTVTEATIREIERPDPALEACVLGRAERVLFPRPVGGGVVMLRVPLRFHTVE